LYLYHRLSGRLRATKRISSGGKGAETPCEINLWPAPGEVIDVDPRPLWAARASPGLLLCLLPSRLACIAV